MKILIITDAWKPQINGVVTTLLENIAVLSKTDDILVIHPYLDEFKLCNLPKYNDISIVLNPWKMTKIINDYQPDAIHIVTNEGTLGTYARIYCNIKKYEYTSSYHTKFDEYLYHYLKIPIGISKYIMKCMYSTSKNILVTTQSMKNELESIGYKNLIIWNRGINSEVFYPTTKYTNNLPVLLYVGRVSKEKNIEAFLDIDINAIKIVVGDGPELNRLILKYENDINIRFVGSKKNGDLAEFYNYADVFVFPSKSDTFGIVMLEAIACGTPIAAYPVTGPIDVVIDNENGFLSTDLSYAISKCLDIDRNKVLKTSKSYTWTNCAAILKQSLVKINHE